MAIAAIFSLKLISLNSDDDENDFIAPEVELEKKKSKSSSEKGKGQIFSEFDLVFGK